MRQRQPALAVLLLVLVVVATSGESAVTVCRSNFSRWGCVTNDPHPMSIEARDICIHEENMKYGLVLRLHYLCDDIDSHIVMTCDILEETQSVKKKDHRNRRFAHSVERSGPTRPVLHLSSPLHPRGDRSGESKLNGFAEGLAAFSHDWCFLL